MIRSAPKASPKADRCAAVREWLRSNGHSHFEDPDLNERELFLRYPGGVEGFEREYRYARHTRPPMNSAGW